MIRLAAGALYYIYKMADARSDVEDFRDLPQEKGNNKKRTE